MVAKTKVVKLTEQQEEAVLQAAALLGDDTFSAESLNPALESLYADMGMTDDTDATVHVTMLEQDATESHIWKGAPEDYDLENLARKFGSGKYRVKVYVKIETGQKVVKANKVFSWKLSPEDEARRLNPQSVQPAQQFNPVDMSRMIAEAVKAAMPQAPVAPPIDPMQQLKGMAEIFATMHQNGVNGVQAAPTDPFAQMRSMIEIVNLMNGDSDPIERGVNASGTDLLMKAVDKFVPMLTTIMQQGQAPGQAVAATAPQLAAPSQPQATETANTEPSEEEQMQVKLVMGLRFLVSMCVGGGLPETYAEVVVDNVPDEMLQELIQHPDPVGYLAQFEPTVGNNREWFVKLIDEVKAMFEDDPDAPATAEVKDNTPPA